MTEEKKENGNYGSEGGLVDFKLNKTNVVVQFNKNTFKSNMNNFIKNYIFYNPLRDESKLINYISKHNFDYYEKNPTLLCLFWNIDIIEDQIISKIPLNVFNIDLEQCDEKEQLQYYKEQCFLIKKIIKINDLMIDQIKLREFNKNCWFKIYSFDEYVNFTAKPLVQVKDVGHAAAKRDVLNAIYQDLSPYYAKINMYGNDSTDLDQLLQKQNIKKHNPFYFLQKKPFIISINFYEEKIIISDCHLIFNENFADPIGTNAFTDYFTKDIILHSKLKYIDRIYKSNILIIFNLTLNANQQKSEITLFYQLVYKSNKLYLKYLKCAYVDVSSKKAVFYSPNDKLFLPIAEKNNYNDCRHIFGSGSRYHSLSNAFPNSKCYAISYNQSKGQNGSFSYSISCSVALGNITLYHNQQ